MTTMPAQKPGRSKQDYATPPEFIAAVKHRLRIREFGIDLAASADNAKASRWVGQLLDSLSLEWGTYELSWDGWAWLNPPYTDIGAWAKKCADARPEKIALLVPAAVGANWFRDHVDGKAHVLLLNGRISFDGIAPYPKDCVLCLYGPCYQGYSVWDWRHELSETQEVEA